MKKVIVTHNVINSAIPTALQIPLIPNNVGSKRIIIIWKTRVRRKEIAADITPLFSAVKKEDPKMLNPQIRKVRLKIRKPWQVSRNSSASYPTKI